MDVRAYICHDPVDIRNAIDELSHVIGPLLTRKPASSLYLSSSRATAPQLRFFTGPYRPCALA